MLRTFVVAVIAALVLTACDDGSSSLRDDNGGDTLRTDGLTTQGTSFGPDIELKTPDQTSNAWTIWASVRAADSSGISISGVKTGDTVTLDYIHGVAYFDGQSGWSMVSSIVIRTLGSVVPVGDGKLTFSGQTVPAPSTNSQDVSKLRDGWGRDVEGRIGKYAKAEGGIVICMPSSKRRSLIYAHVENRLKNEESRGKENFQDNSEWKKDPDNHRCFFPLLDEPQEYDAKEDGALVLYAFDIKEDNSILTLPSDVAQAWLPEESTEAGGPLL